MKNRQQSGFSIIEVVLAIGIVSLIIVSLVGLLLPIQEGLRTGNLTAAASRLLPVLDAKLNTGDDSSLAPVLESDTALLAVYQVRVRPEFNFNEEPAAADLNPGIKGGINSGFRIVPVARRSWKTEEIKSWVDDADAIDGPAFLVQVRTEKEARLQPAQLTKKTPPEVLVLTCDWYELPVGAPRETWDAILVNQRSILKIPIVLRP